MGAYQEPVSDPPGWELRIEWADRDARRAVGRLLGPDVEHSGTGLYTYLETRRGGDWVPRFQLRQVGAIFEEPAWTEIGPDGRAFELQPLEPGWTDIVLVIPPLDPGEHRIRKDFTVAGTEIRLHAPVPDNTRDAATR